MISWRIHHKAETVSTNLDARVGAAGDVFTADYQTAGRGRLDHKWLSPPRTNLMMSVVLSVADLTPEVVATLPLVVGLSVAKGLSSFTGAMAPTLKWPNDILIGRRKIAGILCELNGDVVIAGIGVNVKKQDFSPELSDKAISLGTVPDFRGPVPSVETVRDVVLAALDETYSIWRLGGFAAVYPEIRALDFLRGQALIVRQTDNDTAPLRGFCGGILPDGSLDVGGEKVYAGEAHVERIG